MPKRNVCVVFDRQNTFLPIYFAVYVDDIIIAGHQKDLKSMEYIKLKITNEIKISDKGGLDYLLGIKVMRNRSNKTLTIHQEKYIEELLMKYHMSTCHPSQTPQVLGEPNQDAQQRKIMKRDFRTEMWLVHYSTWCQQRVQILPVL